MANFGVEGLFQVGQDVQLFFFVLGQCVLLLELEDPVLQVVVDSVLLQIFLVGVEQRLARLALAQASRVVLANALTMVGVSTPEKM